ncbi:hypothetical protein M5689_003184 [Euphorbia peplus]|nr:hypothetical protein M5689_003184 [Euphorbia peplus]
MMTGACLNGDCWSPEHVELIAILNGIIFAQTCGFQRLIIGSDCKRGIDLINSGINLSYLTQSVSKFENMPQNWILLIFCMIVEAKTRKPMN